MRITESKLRQIVKKELVNEIFGLGKPKKIEKLNAKDGTKHAKLLKVIISSVGGMMRKDKSHEYLQKLGSDMKTSGANEAELAKLMGIIKQLDQQLNSDKYLDDDDDF